MLIISEESFFALGNQKGWDKLEAAMDPFKLLKAIARLHFISHIDNHDAMEEDVYDKLDDIRQGTHEALGAYTSPVESECTDRVSISRNTPSCWKNLSCMLSLKLSNRWDPNFSCTST